MDMLGFIASIIDSLAWPAAVVILVLILQSPLRKLLLHLTRFRYGDVEIDFGREVHKLEDRAKTAGLQLPERPARPKTEIGDSTQIIADAERLAADFPEPAVGLAWTGVEHELMQAVMRLAISADYPPHGAPLKNIALLRDQGYLDDETRELLDRMRNLRNAAVHAARETSRISADEAREFIALAEAVTEKLKSLTR